VAVKSEFMTLNEAAELLGVSRPTLWRRIVQSEIPVFQSPQDRRHRLVKREDIERMLMPVELVPGKELAAQNLAA
jgi:excisionase family DNA binding protein